MAEYKKASISWVAQAITATVGGEEQTIQLPEFSAEIDPDTEGRLDVFIIRLKVGGEWEYWATISDSNINTSVEPGVESWNQLRVAQIEFKRTPYAVELESPQNSNIDCTHLHAIIIINGSQHIQCQSINIIGKITDKWFSIFGSSQTSFIL